jgi:predicted anti-sigma-YlaC factor YlaD
MAADYTHSPTPEEIMEYLDGEGTAAARATIGAHLAGCATCKAIASEQRGISEAAGAWSIAPAPSSLRLPAAPRARVLAPVMAWRSSRFVLACLTAAAAVLIVISFTAREQRGTDGRHGAIARASVLKNASAAESVDAIGSVSVPKADPVAGRVAGRAGVASSLARGEASAILGQAAPVAPPRTPAVIRTARLSIVAKDFSAVRSAVEAVVAQSGGFIDQMTITGDNTTARELRGTLRVPGDRMAAALARLRQIGQVVEDTQGSQDVTDQIVDLDARLVSARATEQRLTELLRNRTGKLSDVLEVERELARVRLDIERLDAEKTNMGRRVTYATIDVSIAEERKAGLVGPLSLGTRIRIAAADGLESALESIALTLLFFLRAGPTLLLWGLTAGLVWVFGRRFMKPSA